MSINVNLSGDILTYTDNDLGSIRLQYKCPKCDQRYVVFPTFFAESGIPICTGEPSCEGDDMELQKVSVELPFKAIADVVNARR